MTDTPSDFFKEEIGHEEFKQWAVAEYGVDLNGLKFYAVLDALEDEFREVMEDARKK